MKIRTGFVSNSSSSSFCIIGTDNTDLIKKIAEADDVFIDDMLFDRGAYCSKNIQYYGDYSPWYAGIDAEEILNRMTIPEAKKHVSKLLSEKLNLDIPPAELDFLFGEAGTG
jgi:hypothetical protein